MPENKDANEIALTAKTSKVDAPESKTDSKRSKAEKAAARAERKQKKAEEKKKNLTWKRVWQNTWFGVRTIHTAAPGVLSRSIISPALSALINFMGETYMLRMIVNSYSGGIPVNRVIIYIAAIWLANTAASLLDDMAWYSYFYKANIRLQLYIKKSIFKKSREVELACYEDPQFYDKYVKAGDEATNKIYDIMNIIWRVIWCFVSFSATSLLIFTIDPVLMIFGILPLLLGLLSKKRNEVKHELDNQQKVVGRKQKYVRRAFYLGEYAKEIRLTFIGSTLFRMFGDAYREYKANVRKYGPRLAFFSLCQRFGMDGVVILGAMLYSAFSALVIGRMSIGDCIVVFSGIAAVSENLRLLVTSATDFQKNALYIEDYRHFLEYEPKIKPNETGRTATGGDIELCDVTFRYEGADKDALCGVSMSIKQGEKIALVGANGSGKSTLVKLLLRFYDPSSGEIRLDGTPLPDYSLDSYREQFGVVFQECKCFSMSVAENVLMRPLRDGDAEIVTEALKQSGAWEKISSLPDGINTILTREFDDKGTVLSGGELQKVELARIFAVQTPFVILDEPSSALDPVAEYNMFENMMHACEGRTAVIISHRLSSAVLADRIYLMDGGRVIESGTHAELMAQNGRYAGMFRMQAENYIGEGEENG